jgi:hypothetical protein
VASIASNGFGACSALATLTFEGATVPTFGPNVFIDASPSGTLYYPAGSEASYTDGRFTSAGLPAGWTFTPLSSGPTTGAPASGDLDGDGTATAAEALQLARAVIDGTAASTFTVDQFAAMDMDLDGSLTMSDALIVIRYAMGLS